ncbi:unnamed protein product [Effrenium voratum]|uniref:Pacifastin domain-containing protein n=1 Tax=Effrenium voratum TaxID=2562239 RepID=A0AA36JBB8_9DINO|nr:unnamed protein product [Effrenium voratum]
MGDFLDDTNLSALSAKTVKAFLDLDLLRACCGLLQSEPRALADNPYDLNVELPGGFVGEEQERVKEVTHRRRPLRKENKQEEQKRAKMREALFGDRNILLQEHFVAAIFKSPASAGWCAPFSVFPKGDGLNSCTCSSSGSKDQAQCTELACPKVVLPPGPNPRPVEEGACCPGRSFTASDGCNTCRCAGSGLKNESVCTRMACPPWMAITENCTAFSTYPAGDGLNTCVCPADGKKSEEFCTSLKCPEPKEEEEDRCCPGVSFPASDGCNTCVCPGSGLMSEAACTLMACPPRPTILPPGRCTPFVAFPKGDGTNTCTCPASGLSSEARCTHLPCQATLLP